MSKGIVVTVGLVAIFGLVPLAQASLFVDFESPTYSTTAGTPSGNLDGQGGWAVSAGNPVVVGANAGAIAGLQSVSFPIGAKASRSLAGAGFTDVTTFTALLGLQPGADESDISLAANTGSGFQDFVEIGMHRMTVAGDSWVPWRGFNGGDGWGYFGGYQDGGGPITALEVATINFTTQTYDVVITDPNNPAVRWTSTGNSFVNPVTQAQAEASGKFSVNYNGLDMVLDNVGISAAVPEPSTMVILVSGMVGLLAYAWRKRM
jgi:hypothetical protein